MPSPGPGPAGALIWDRSPQNSEKPLSVWHLVMDALAKTPEKCSPKPPRRATCMCCGEPLLPANGLPMECVGSGSQGPLAGHRSGGRQEMERKARVCHDGAPGGHGPGGGGGGDTCGHGAIVGAPETGSWAGMCAGKPLAMVLRLHTHADYRGMIIEKFRKVNTGEQTACEQKVPLPGA